MKEAPIHEAHFFEPIEVSADNTKDYQPAENILFDLIHTSLKVSFDWEKQYVNGEATLTLKPYFYSQKELTLDAKGFDIKDVILLLNDQQKILSYHYDSLQLKINLEKEYARTDTFQVKINYTAKPNELQTGGSDAIKMDKGLYFINPLGTENKPQQIWTQGETEASSKWFPTIDAPNQKMTQEIYITVNNKFKTLSNGSLVYGTDNGNGTRTDYWKQELPHAPYLTMLAVGEFSVVKDKWEKGNGEDMEVNYYVEPKYENHAQHIFGNTPEMISFYSEKTGVPYPWDKYSQIIVRDFVSGAMENTTAVVHGEFLQQTKREMLDGDYEYIIAHELFHHWFGDYVTCESWANLPLNESFATYGEYLWSEYKYGQNAADLTFQNALRDYLSESSEKQEPLIRYYYHDKEDMFDSHSYEKGGCVLHMLRNYVGDDAFFMSIQNYLRKYAFKAVEIHDLRRVFEEVTGEDLKWFFDQWFMEPGHPILGISYHYDSLQSMQYIYVEQERSRDFGKELVYKLPIQIAIYNGSGLQVHDIIIDEKYDTFKIKVNEPPLCVNFDYEKVLLAQKREKKPLSQWIYQFKNAKRYLNKSAAFYRSMLAFEEDSLACSEVILEALTDSFWSVRSLGMTFAEDAQSVHSKKVKDQLAKLSLSDPDARIRAMAIGTLHDLYRDSVSIDFYKTLLDDQSFGVLVNALYVIYDLNPEEGTKIAQQFEAEDNLSLQLEVARIYSKEGLVNKNDFMLNLLNKSSNYNKVSTIMIYQRYLTHDSVISKHFDEGLILLKNTVLNNEPIDNRTYALSAIKLMKAELEHKQEQTELIKAKLVLIEEAMNELREKVTHEDLIPYLNLPEE